MKKPLAWAATLAVLLTAFLVNASAAVLPFRDVPQNAWYAEDVQRATDRGLMEGVSSASFRPEDPLTRAQAVAILCRMQGGKTAAPDYTDVPSSAWYAPYVGWAQTAGVATGQGDGTFQPERSITRQELAVMISRCLRVSGLELPASPEAPVPFWDEAAIADWAVDAVEAMRLSGLMRGDGGAFQPLSTATRAEAATLAVRLADAMDAHEAQVSGQEPAIAGGPLKEYRLYTAEPDFLSLEAARDSLADLTGVSLETADKAGEKTIVFAVDESLPRLEYQVKEGSGVLTFAVSSRYALPYMPQILESFYDWLGGTRVPAGYSHAGTFALDTVDSFPENTVFQFSGETDRNPLSYSSGSDVTFRVSFLQGNRLVAAPTFHYTWSTDDGKKSGATVPGHSGQFVVTLPGCSVPGTAYLDVRAADASSNALKAVEAQFLGSVVFDFGKITTTRPAPADFRAFWQAQMDRLMASEPTELSFEACTGSAAKDNPDYDTYDAVVQTPWDEAYMHITVPKNAAPGSLDMRINVSGYGFGSFGPHYKSNTISVSVTPHSFPNDQSSEYYKEQQEKLRCWVDASDTRESAYFLPMLMRDIQSIRYVEEKFADLWNHETMEVTGGSMGGFQSIAIGALYDKVTRVIPSIIWMCDLGGGNDGRNDGWAPPWSEAGQYYDTVYFAPYITCPVTGIYAGLGDYTSPPSGIIALYNALTCEKSISFAQNAKHNGQAGEYNGSFSIEGEPVNLDPMLREIRDNGCAVPDPADPS